MAENLFSKYRPLILDEVFGHDKIKQEFKKRILDKNIPKCILITGPSGVGKNCLEKILSKSILCKHTSKDDPCNDCDQCKTVINEKASNYYYLFNASNLGIDEMRSIEDLASKRNLSTIQDKVIIIDELQELGNNQKALKSLLKILERPMDHTYFFLLAMDETKIPSALKNRCVHYKLKDLSFEEIAKHLLMICEKESIVIDTEDKANTLITISQNSNGSMRTAISYLERCLYSELWNPKTVLEELGIVSNDTLNTIMNQLLTGDVKIFENEINKDILEKIRWILGILYKHKFGVTLNQYQKSYIMGIQPVAIEVIARTIDLLNKLTLLPYINQELIDFTLIEILSKNKTASNQLVAEVKVRERKRI